ncbi:MAG: aminotransferase class V-fold PLP-dependent enzyme, partial [Gemmatimonadaceae bacterium]|nr:aminotransferase class V-fold PLP-dependent enzyme [Gemmatimonadaceae bacterium]
IAQLEPHMVGWTAVAGGDDFARLLEYDLTWRDDARRFESLTLPVHDFFGFNASLELLMELGVPSVAAHVESLVDDVVAWAATQEGFTLATPATPSQRAGIVSLRCDDPAGASARLAAARVAHSMRGGLLRLSPHGFNTHAEIAAALDALSAR